MISKMSVIYEPRGKAKEYSPLAANLYSGCSHGCTYCYVPTILRKTREDFLDAKKRDKILQGLEKDCYTLYEHEDNRQILLSFTSDPYQPLEAHEKLTRSAIESFIRHELRFTILTKGGELAQRDFELYKNYEKASFGVTLHSLDEELCKQYEPFAAPPSVRVENLKKAKKQGISTWVSCEPVICASDALNMIQRTHLFVDKYMIGKMNHEDTIEGRTDWGGFRESVVDLLQELGKDYYIKKDLREYGVKK